MKLVFRLYLRAALSKIGLPAELSRSVPRYSWHAAGKWDVSPGESSRADRDRAWREAIYIAAFSGHQSSFHGPYVLLSSVDARGEGALRRDKLASPALNRALCAGARAGRLCPPTR